MNSKSCWKTFNSIGLCKLPVWVYFWWIFVQLLYLYNLPVGFSSIVWSTNRFTDNRILIYGWKHGLYRLVVQSNRVNNSIVTLGKQIKKIKVHQNEKGKLTVTIDQSLSCIWTKKLMVCLVSIMTFWLNVCHLNTHAIVLWRLIHLI